MTRLTNLLVVGLLLLYKPDDYLKNPVYSRDWPPCKHC